MNHLAEYIRAAEITQRQFAEAIGADQSIVSRLCAKLIKPSIKRAIAIERATKGAVPASIWVDE